MHRDSVKIIFICESEDVKKKKKYKKGQSVSFQKKAAKKWVDRGAAKYVD